MPQAKNHLAIDLVFVASSFSSFLVSCHSQPLILAMEASQLDKWTPITFLLLYMRAPTAQLFNQSHCSMNRRHPGAINQRIIQGYGIGCETVCLWIRCRSTDENYSTDFFSCFRRSFLHCNMRFELLMRGWMWWRVIVKFVVCYRQPKDLTPPNKTFGTYD